MWWANDVDSTSFVNFGLTKLPPKYQLWPSECLLSENFGCIPMKFVSATLARQHNFVCVVSNCWRILTDGNNLNRNKFLKFVYHPNRFFFCLYENYYDSDEGLKISGAHGFWTVTVLYSAIPYVTPDVCFKVIFSTMDLWYSHMLPSIRWWLWSASSGWLIDYILLIVENISLIYSLN